MVIGIIAVLISILLPALGRARRQARTVVCMSNLRQLGAAYQAYMNEYRSKGLPEGGSGGNEDGWPIFLLEPHPVLWRVMLCPEAMTPASMSGWNKGTVSLAWFNDFNPGPNGDYEDYDADEIPFHPGSFGINRWLLVAWNPDHSFDAFNLMHPKGQPETIPMFGDCCSYGATPTPLDPAPRDLAGTSSNEDMDAFCIARHGRAINMVFLDGHAVTVPLAELWQLNWNSGWVVNKSIVLPAK